MILRSLIVSCVLLLQLSLIVMVTATNIQTPAIPITSVTKSAAWTTTSHAHDGKKHSLVSSYLPFHSINDHDDKDDDKDKNHDDHDENDDDDKHQQWDPERIRYELLLGERSALCRQYDCPSFNATSYPTYTLRTYSNSSFACTSIRSFKYGEGEDRKAFERLYDYFGGESSSGTKINMTVPVIRYVQPGNGSHPNVSVCFFIPDSLRDSIPTPNNRDIHILSLSFTVAIRPFFGYSTHENVGRNLIEHQIALHLAGQDYNKQRYVHAAYTEPWIPFFRYNEIWTFIKPQPGQTGDEQDFWNKHVQKQQPNASAPQQHSKQTHGHGTGSRPYQPRMRTQVATMY